MAVEYEAAVIDPGRLLSGRSRRVRIAPVGRARDVDLVIAPDAVDRAVHLLEAAGFTSARFAWSVNLKGRSAVSIRLSTEEFYREYPARAVPADVHGILLRVASLDDTLAGDPLPKS